MANPAHDPIVIANVFVTVCAPFGQLSLTVICTLLYVPAVVGVPLMAPDELLIVKPAGRPVADQVKGVTPPLDATVVE